MNFVTTQFALFFLIVLTIWWASQRAPAARRGLLLAANLAFYAATGLTFVPLLMGTALLNWGVALGMAARWGAAEGGGEDSPRNGPLAPRGEHLPAAEKKRRKAWLIAGVALNLCLLAFFKYYEFLMVELSGALGLAGLHLPVDALLPESLADMAFPIGISFYIFQGIAYLADHHAAPDLRPQPFVRVLLYLSFFPTVLSGPILRPGQFFPQLDALTSPPAARPGMETSGVPQTPASAWPHAAARPEAVDARAVQEGFALILSGLFKKVVLASYLSEHVVRDAFQGPEGFSSWGILLAVYGYSMQIYCDFSGYTDMALGVGRLLGFTLPQNFDSPYLARNLQDFWRRWHMTLSSWLRDYLYVPLGGSRHGGTYRNLMITMLLGGLWHGAHTRFLIWGGMHGLGLCLVHAARSLRPKGASSDVPGAFSAAGRVFSWFLTFHFVTVAWVFFGAEDAGRACDILLRIVNWGLPGQGFPLMALPAVACALCIQIVGKDLLRSLTDVQERLPLPARAAVLALLCGLILRMGPDGVLPFIYFQF